MSTLGAELKRRREAKGVTLSQLADSTRIGIRFLQAIESDDYKSLPGGIFNRSFVKAYAKAVGLSEQEALEAYQKQTGAASPLSDAPLQAVPTVDVRRESLPEINWQMVVVGAAIVGVLAFVGWGVYAKFKRQAPPPAQVQTPATSPPPPVADSTTAPGAVPPVLTAGAQPPQPTPDQVAPATPASQFAFTVDITALGDSYIGAQWDAEKGRKDLSVKAGETRTIQANEKILLTIGLLPSVTVKVNGKDVKLPSRDGRIARDVLINQETLQSILDGTAVPAPIKRKPKPAVTPTQPGDTPPAAKPKETTP